MKSKIYIGKTKEEAIKNALIDLNAKEDEVVIIEKETKKSLFNKKIEIEAITKSDLNKEIKDFLYKTVKDMGFDCNIETKKRDEQLIYNIITSTSSVLIGKNGRTIDALQNLALQMISTKYNTFYRFTVDINDYKQKRKQRLEKLAKYTAKDVAKSKQAVNLEPMNSYERRIIHNILTNSTDVITTSEGEEPNRYVIIKPKEDSY
jgi:spoIIIJ-associated protein